MSDSDRHRPGLHRARTAYTDDGFEMFWRRTHHRLERIVSRTFGPTDADEVVQEAMLRLHDRWEQFESDQDAFPWLVVVARRVAIDRMRARQRRESAEIASMEIVEPAQPDDIVCERELRNTVREAFAGLSEADRSVLCLHHVRGLPTAHIATLTGRSDNAVRQQLFRARRNLSAGVRRMSDGLACMTPVSRCIRRLTDLDAACLAVGTTAPCLTATGAAATRDVPTPVIRVVVQREVPRASDRARSHLPSTPQRYVAVPRPAVASPAARVAMACSAARTDYPVHVDLPVATPWAPSGFT